jgi:hypothetical protein
MLWTSVMVAVSPVGVVSSTVKVVAILASSLCVRSRMLLCRLFVLVVKFIDGDNRVIAGWGLALAANGQNEAKLLKTRFQLPELGWRMLTRLATQRLERVNTDTLWVEVAEKCVAIPANGSFCNHSNTPCMG